MRAVIPLLFVFALAGCAGGGADSACEVFSPPPPMDPGGQSAERVETLSTGDQTQRAGRQDC